MKLALFVGTLGVCSVLASAGCKSGWQGSNELGACYKLYRERVPWLKGALNFCAIKDGSAAAFLAEPRSKDQLKFIFEKFRGEYWMGITDTHKDGVWRYNSDSTIVPESLLPFHSREPNNYGGSEDCIIKQNPGFADYPCYSKNSGLFRYALCEYTPAGH